MQHEIFQINMPFFVTHFVTNSASLAWFVVADFAFATLPWFILWKLDIKRKEKVTIACGLSLGIL